MTSKNGTVLILFLLLLHSHFGGVGVRADSADALASEKTIRLETGVVFDASISQDGTDLELELVGPNGTSRLTADRPNGSWGTERLICPIDETGDWKIRFWSGGKPAPVDISKLTISGGSPAVTVSEAEGVRDFHIFRKQGNPEKAEQMLTRLPVWFLNEARLNTALLWEKKDADRSLEVWKAVDFARFEPAERNAYGAIYWWLGARLFEGKGKFSEAETRYLESLRIYRLLGDRRRTGMLTVESARMAHRLGRFDIAEQRYSEGLPLIPPGSRTRALGDYNFGEFLLEKGRFGAARRVLSNVSTVAVRLQDPKLHWMCIEMLARIDTYLGYPEVAEARLLRDALALQNQLSPDTQALLLADIAEIKRLNGKPGEALKLCREAQALARLPWTQAAVGRVLSSVLFSAGRAEEGIRCSEEALKKIPPYDPLAALLELDSADRLIRSGKPAEGLQLARKYTTGGSPDFAARAALIAAVAAFRIGDFAASESFYRQAAEEYGHLSGLAETVAEKRSLGRAYGILPGLGASLAEKDPAEALRRVERFRCRSAFPVGNNEVVSITTETRRSAESARAVLLAKGDPDSRAAAERIARDLLLDSDDESIGDIPVYSEEPWKSLEPDEVAIVAIAGPTKFFLVCRKNGVTASRRLPPVVPGERRIFIPDPFSETHVDLPGSIEASSLGLYLALRDRKSEVTENILAVGLGAEIQGLPKLTGAAGDVAGVDPKKVRIVEGPLNEDRLHQELVKVKPAIVHFGTHGAPDEVLAGKTAVLVSGSDGPLPITARVFRNLPASPQVVVLAACRTTFGPRFGCEGKDDLPTEIIRSGVPCVVAADGPLEDGYSERFFKVFYRGITRGKSVSESLKFALRTVGQPPAGTHIRIFGSDRTPFPVGD